jgi:NtrC-family two-component system response regulator AlgB
MLHDFPSLMDILIIDDEKIIRDAVTQLAEDQGHDAQSAADGPTALDLLKGGSYDLALLDVNLGGEDGLELLQEIQRRHPALPVVVFTAAASIKVAVEAMRLGALDFLEKPFTPAHLTIMLARVQKHRQLTTEVVELQSQVESSTPEPIFDSESPAMTEALDVLFRAAATQAGILILGESGTGKSVVARAVHGRSARAAKPFVTVNCPSLSRELLESDLFGHVRGSFTGALKDHWGKVRTAEGGTLFLDEIGELPLEIQPKLLRLLQDREYERLGENTTRTADVRVIAATNRDLAAEVAAGRFREDLFYRLNVITVTMPPLRARPQDIVRFAGSYLRFFASQCRRALKTFDESARRQLLNRTWPGNLRELRNAVERAVILARGPGITGEDLADASGASGAPAPGALPSAGQLITLEELETAHLRAVMASTPHLSEAAEILGIDQTTLYRKRKKLGLDAPSRSEPEVLP